LKLESRSAISRKTNETDIYIHLNLDGTGKSKIETGIAFFDHMLDQIARHGQMDLEILVKEI
jgi:imidazoleglycerol-phosphate dehydratase/histidinol-phosphatase